MSNEITIMELVSCKDGIQTESRAYLLNYPVGFGRSPCLQGEEDPGDCTQYGHISCGDAFLGQHSLGT